MKDPQTWTTTMWELTVGVGTDWVEQDKRGKMRQP